MNHAILPAIVSENISVLMMRCFFRDIDSTIVFDYTIKVDKYELV